MAIPTSFTHSFTFQLFARMVLSGLSMVHQEGITVGAWRSALGRRGELSAMTTGVRSMLMWLADSLDSQDSVSSININAVGWFAVPCNNTWRLHVIQHGPQHIVLFTVQLSLDINHFTVQLCCGLLISPCSWRMWKAQCNSCSNQLDPLIFLHLHSPPPPPPPPPSSIICT